MAKGQNKERGNQNKTLNTLKCPNNLTTFDEKPT